MRKRQSDAAQMFHFAVIDPYPCLSVEKTNPSKESISVCCSGRVSIHTTKALRHWHPALFHPPPPSRRDSTSELSQLLGGYHDTERQTLGAGNPVSTLQRFCGVDLTRLKYQTKMLSFLGFAFEHGCGSRLPRKCANVCAALDCFFHYSSNILLALHCCRHAYTLTEISLLHVIIWKVLCHWLTEP